MNSWLLAFIFLVAVTPLTVTAKDSLSSIEVIVTVSYLDMRTGPGKGFPIFHVVEKGENITLVKEKTDWIKVRTQKGKEGWIYRTNLAGTIGANGETVNLGIPKRGDVTKNPWELGATVGEFDDIESLGVHGSYRANNNISLELRFNQATGRFSNSQMFSWGVKHQPFPSWRLSPFFVLANGKVKVSPNSGLSQFQAREDSFFMLGVGSYYHFNHRIIFRFEFNSYNSLNTVNSENGNDKIEEWKIGLSTFF